MDLFMSFCCGALSVLLLGAVWEIKRLKRDIANITTDLINLGNSFQKCFDELVRQVNNNSEGIKQHQKAIDYLTKECSDD